MRKTIAIIAMLLLMIGCTVNKPATEPIDPKCEILAMTERMAIYMADFEGKPLLMDFKIKLASIKNAPMPFSAFNGQTLMIYHFSPFCPHCQKGPAALNRIQQIANEYKHKGLASIALSVPNADTMEILAFMEQQEATMPFFQDSEKEFSKRYGDGYVPRLFLISADGKIIRYTTFRENMDDIRTSIEKMLDVEK